MLGSVSEADDAVQEAWLRLSSTDETEIENLGGWLTTVVARVSLNMLRSRRTRREEPLGVHVPEPIIDRADGLDPEHEALLADSVGLALLVVLETLSPPERLAFVLHDIFAMPFDEIAPIVDRSPEAARQLASRPGGAFRARPPFPTPTSQRSAGSSTPSSPPRARATSRRCSRCSIPTSCCASTSVPRRNRGRCAGRGWLPARRSSTRGSAWTSGPRSSTAPPGSSRSGTGSPTRSEASRSAAGRSLRWTSWPTRSGCAG